MERINYDDYPEEDQKHFFKFYLNKLQTKDGDAIYIPIFSHKKNKDIFLWNLYTSALKIPELKRSEKTQYFINNTYLKLMSNPFESDFAVPSNLTTKDLYFPFEDFEKDKAADLLEWRLEADAGNRRKTKSKHERNKRKSKRKSKKRKTKRRSKKS